MEINKKELKEQEVRTMFITPALQQKGWAVSVNMREEYYFTDGRVLVVGNQHSVAEGKKADYLLYHKGLVTCLAWKMPSLTGGERLLPFMKQEKANSDRVRLPL